VKVISIYLIKVFMKINKKDIIFDENRRKGKEMK